MATEPLPISEDKTVPIAPAEPFVSISYKRSPTIGKLVAAMCKAQLAFDPVKKESENPAFARGGKVSKYADLFSLISATRKGLNTNGLTIMQFPNLTVNGKVLVVETLLAHESEEWISCELMLPAADERGFTAHSIGKAMTYARRYSWQSITGTVGEDDDDGNDASGVGSKAAAQAVAEAKIAQFKAKKAAEQPPKQYPDQLCLLPLNNNLFEVSGDPEVMNAHKELLLANGKRKGEKVHMTAEQLATFRYQFEDQRGGIITTLKPTERQPGED